MYHMTKTLIGFGVCFFGVCGLFGRDVLANTIAPVVAPMPDDNQTLWIPQQTTNQTEQINSVRLGNDGQYNRLELTQDELVRNPDVLQRLFYAVVTNEDVSAIEKFLPLYQQLPSADAVLIIYARALLADEIGEYAHAIDGYRKVLASAPQMSMVRFRLAIALAKNKAFVASREQFAKVRADDMLDVADIQKIDEIEQALTKQKQWNGSFGMRYLSENNVNNAPKDRQYGNFTFESPKKAHGIGYHANVEYSRPIADHMAWQSSVNLYGKSYWDTHDYDDLVLRGETGLQWNDSKTEFNLSPYFEKRYYGTTPYSQDVGMLGGVGYRLSSKWQNYSSVQVGRRVHQERTFLDGNHYTVSSMFVYRASPLRFWFGGMDTSYTDTKDDSNRFYRIGMRVGVGQEWQNGTSGNAQIATAKRYYAGTDILNIKRQDTEYNVSLSIWNRNWYWQGLTPKLVWQYSKTDSNHPLYRYDDSQVFVQVDKRF